MSLWDSLMAGSANSLLASVTLVLVGLVAVIASRRRRGPR